MGTSAVYVTAEKLTNSFCGLFLQKAFYSSCLNELACCSHRPSQNSESVRVGGVAAFGKSAKPTLLATDQLSYPAHTLRAFAVLLPLLKHFPVANFASSVRILGIFYKRVAECGRRPEQG